MPVSYRTRGLTTRPPHRTSAATTAIWVFVVIEAIGIGFAVWAF